MSAENIQLDLHLTRLIKLQQFEYAPVILKVGLSDYRIDHYCSRHSKIFSVGRLILSQVQLYSIEPESMSIINLCFLETLVEFHYKEMRVDLFVIFILANLVVSNNIRNNQHIEENKIE